MENVLTKVSVIVPVYNAENSLQKCIESILNQTHTAFEIFIVNDGSTDNSDLIAKQYKDKIIYFEQTNQGQAVARNAGLKNATGDFIAFLDADDYWQPEFLKTCVNYLNQYNEIVAVWTAGILILDKNNKILVPEIMRSDNANNLKPMVLDNFFNFWATQEQIQNGSVTLRHEVVKKAGLQIENRVNCEDYEYWALIATYGKWLFVPEPLFVNNSKISARGKWLKRYKKRRNLCPDVETWEKRVLPRLKKEDMFGFNVVKGRVASGYAHNKILSGRYREGMEIVKKFGTLMQPKKLNKLMIIATKLGYPAWRIVCFIIKLKEVYKAFKMR